MANEIVISAGLPIADLRSGNTVSQSAGLQGDPTIYNTRRPANKYFKSAGLPAPDLGKATANSVRLSAGFPAFDVYQDQPITIYFAGDVNGLTILTDATLTAESASTIEFIASAIAASALTTIASGFILALVSPADTSSQDTPVTFSWGSHPGATAYNLQVSTTSNFSNIVTNIWTASRSYEDSSLDPSTTYYWRVRAA